MMYTKELHDYALGHYRVCQLVTKLYCNIVLIADRVP